MNNDNIMGIHTKEMLLHRCARATTLPTVNGNAILLSKRLRSLLRQPPSRLAFACLPLSKQHLMQAVCPCRAQHL